MSDPMTNLQIEDVLSSIRRLVAEGDKSRASDTSFAKAEKPVNNAPVAANAPERLVLTPALRVTDDATDQTDQASVRGDAAIRAASESSLDDVTAMAASAASIMRLTPDQQRPVEIVFDDDDTTTDVHEQENALDRVEDMTSPEPAFRHFDRDALSREKTPIHAIDLPEADDADADYGDDLTEDTTPDAQVDEKLNAFLSDDAMLADAGLDEDMLRDLIVDVIRQELQGVMGERITRNVRKLVRREIHRILAAQDLD